MERRHKDFVVFLDVDGVLNSMTTVERTPKGNVGVDFARVAILAKAIKKYGGGDIVLTSDWKYLKCADVDYLYLVSKLEEYKLEIEGQTTEINNNRGAGIIDYLEKHPEIQEYVILDDRTFDFKNYNNLWERLLLTNGIENAEFASRTPAVETIIFRSDLINLL